MTMINTKYNIPINVNIVIFRATISNELCFRLLLLYLAAILRLWLVLLSISSLSALLSADSIVSILRLSLYELSTGVSGGVDRFDPDENCLFNLQSSFEHSGDIHSDVDMVCLWSTDMYIRFYVHDSLPPSLSVLNASFCDAKNIIYIKITIK